LSESQAQIGTAITFGSGIHL